MNGVSEVTLGLVLPATGVNLSVLIDDVLQIISIESNLQSRIVIPLFLNICQKPKILFKESSP